MIKEEEEIKEVEKERENGHSSIMMIDNIEGYKGEQEVEGDEKEKEKEKEKAEAVFF